MPGGHCKTLLMRSREGRFVLAVVDADRRVPMGPFGRALGTGRLSFATAGELHDRLGVTPGSVTPFALVNDTTHSVRLVLDGAMMRDNAVLHYHPLVNTMTTAITPADLLRFFTHTGHAPEYIEFDTLG